MTFEHYWAIVLKQWKLIVGCFLLVGLGTFCVSKIMTPLYQSTVVVQIIVHSDTSQSDYNSLLASGQLVQTEAQLATGDPVLREVASHYAGLTAQQLAAEVTATPKLNTQLFQVDVLDPSPTRASALANDIVNTLIKQQQQATQQDNNVSQQHIQQDLITTQAQIDDVSVQLAKLQAKKGQQALITVLQVRLNGLQQQYNQWQTTLAQLELTQAQSADFLHVVQPAQPGLSPVRPNVPFNTVMSLLVGLFLGILLAVLFEQLDIHVRTADALTQLLDWPVLATVWRSRSTTNADMINPQGHDANVESYRILRTNVGFSSIDKPLHSLMVTSAVPGDGKSTIAANLAIYMAKAGKNTLLIDGDLRRPTQHQLFNLAADKKGLSNAVLTFSAPAAASPSSPRQFTFTVSPSPVPQADASNTWDFSLEPYIHAVGVPNLRVMPSGPLPPNPSELLDSKAIQRLFTALASCGAEVVIVDAPPIRGLSDASILSRKVDGTLVVVDITRANKRYLTQVKTLLSQAGANVLGCVVNKQRHSRSDTSYSYYYYRHDDQHDKGHAKPQSANPFANAAHRGLFSITDGPKNAARVALFDGKKGEQGRNER